MFFCSKFCCFIATMFNHILSISYNKYFCRFWYIIRYVGAAQSLSRHGLLRHDIDMFEPITNLVIM